MRLLTPTLRTPIGIDIGSRSVKIAQAYVRRGKILRHTLASMDVPTAESTTEQATRVAGQIAAFLPRGGFIGGQVALAIPPHLLRMEAVELPKVAPAAIHQLAGMEISRVTRLKNKSFEHGLWELPMPSRGGSSLHVMTAALPHPEADQLCAPFLDAGLDVVALFPQVSTFASLLKEMLNHSDADQLHTLIDIGGGGTRLIILQAGQVLFHRNIPSVSLGTLHSQLQTQLNLPPEVATHILEQVGIATENRNSLGAAYPHIQRIFGAMIDTISSELQLTQNYITHRYQQQTVPTLLLVGGGAAIPGLAAALSIATGREASLLSPRHFTAGSISANSRADASSAHVAALACALYALEELP